MQAKHETKGKDYYEDEVLIVSDLETNDKVEHVLVNSGVGIVMDLGIVFKHFI